MQHVPTSKLCKLTGHIVCDAPNDLLYRFEGTFSPMNTSNPELDAEILNLEYSSFLLRGSKLKNTEWIIAMVIYTGHDSKIMQNQSKAQ